MVGLLIYVLLFSILPDFYDNFLPIEYLESQNIQIAGIGVLITSLIWIIIAQTQMRDSWRIGIDNEINTELVTNGLFRISRNPIFLGMIMSLIGLFLATPNALTLIFLILGYVLTQIQIRLEEEFLTNQHGDKYTAYKQQTRRLL